MTTESLSNATGILLRNIERFSAEDQETVMRTLYAAASWHGSQKRKSGIPFIIHPIEVAGTVAACGGDLSTVCAGLLHDTLEDTDADPEELLKQFGHDVFSLVEAVTKPRHFTQEQFQEKMYVKAMHDPRVATLKLCDVWANTRGTVKVVFKPETHLEHLEEVETFYLHTLAAVPGVSPEAVRLATTAAQESRAYYETRNA